FLLIGWRWWDIVRQPSTAFAQQTLDTLDRVALDVKEIRNPTEQRDVVRTVIASAAATLQWLHLLEFSLPESQHMLWNMKFVSYFADRAEGVGRLLGTVAPDQR